MDVMKALSEKRKERENRDFSDCCTEIKKLLSEAQAIVIGAGSGLSTAAGLTYDGPRFKEHFKEFIERYGMTDMYSAGFYPFKTQEEKWAYWSRHIYYNRYDTEAGNVYRKLLHLMHDKDFFILTTNVDHQFLLAGFPGERVFAFQGDYGKFQCAKACHNKLYDNEEAVRAMMAEQSGCRIPSALVPKCPVCGGNMEVNLRCDGYFVEDTLWHESAARYQAFLDASQGKKTVFLELGVGMNTPGIIKYPFWQMTNARENARYICINQYEAWAPAEIEAKSICINRNISEVLDQIEKE